eukprot:TRINITY_DN7758_c0_g1_i1.p1 TRINITY_DN7758_c0_g1~~TRINITY_DN7758_c0_g1_i1.p1  ORF type:complete len:583 (-),score=83.36 TRINITY_DN7758_c0_g1_i1:400-2148(-)
MGRRGGTAEDKQLAKKASQARCLDEDTSGKMNPRKSKSQNGSQSGSQKVIPFYSDRPGHPYREFSNFYRDSPGYTFTLPACAQRHGLPSTVHCEFAEKAIMVCKAAMMGDEEAFQAICEAKFPKDAKDLGRGVRGFDQKLWTSTLEEVAFEVVRQKFAADAGLRKVLLGTGEKVLVEAAPNDRVWGVGLRVSDDRVYHPSEWCGQNILGYSLMRARSVLRGEPMTPPFSQPLSEEPHDSEELAEPPAAAPVSPPAIDPQETFLRPIDDLDAVKACYDKYGVVGVTGVLSKEECRDLTKNGLEPHLPQGCDMDDPATYSLADGAINRYGVIGKQAIFNDSVLATRLHPNVAAAYKTVAGRDDVFACHDRAAWMRPAAMNAAWDTPFSFPGLHFDVSLANYFTGDRAAVDDFLSQIDYDRGNFQAENNAKHHSMGRTVQGVLNLYDNDVEDGGFHCVPGMFGASLQAWVTKHPALPKPEVNGRYDLQKFGADMEIGCGSVRVPCPAGTLILFDATLPHGTKPNQSMNSRAILFLRYITSDELPAGAWVRRNAALRRVVEQTGFKPTAEQEQHLYGPGPAAPASD